MVGIAREVSAVFPEAVLKPVSPVIPPRMEKLDDFRGVTLEDPDCPFYAVGAIDNVKIKPSPVTARVRLLLSGMRPISNIVDATNIVMLLMGQPLHAFDSAALPDREITVRSARKGEMILTLDGKTRILEETDLLITSGGKPIDWQVSWWRRKRDQRQNLEGPAGISQLPEHKDQPDFKKTGTPQRGCLQVLPFCRPLQG